jgi:type II secretory pathway predicted ATPase ExeA
MRPNYIKKLLTRTDAGKQKECFMPTLKTFKKFGLTQDPFSGDAVKAEDVYLTEDTRKCVIDDSGCEALAAKLRRQMRNGAVYSVAFPLPVNNRRRRAMNEAADLGVNIVDAEVVNSL